MSKLPRTLLLVAATLFSLSSIGNAQLLTANTIGGVYNNGLGSLNGAALSSGTALTQTFSNVTSINTLTFRFISSTPGAGTSLDVYFSEWGGGNDASSYIASGTMTIPASGSWVGAGPSYYDAAIDLTAVASSLTFANTYAFTIVGNADSAAGNYFVGGADPGSPYGDGSTFTHSSVTAFSDLTGGGSSAPGIGDFAFIANTAGGPDSLTLTPVPEASTVAVLFAGVFVGGLVIMRVRQRRQQAATVA